MEAGSSVFQGGNLKDSARERSLANLVPIKPGQVLNPKGGGAAGHALAAYIRDKSLDGTSLADFLFSVVLGKDSIFAKHKDRIEACSLLLNRGWGQAPQTINFERDKDNRPLLDLTKLTPAEFEQFRELALKIAPTAQNDDSDTKQASQDQPGTTISPQDVPKVQPPDNLGSSGMKP